MGVAATPYQQLWGIVSGAVTDAFNRHPNYLTKSGRKYATTSIVKRVTGTVLSFAVAETARSRRAAGTATGDHSLSAPEAGGVARVIRLHSFAHVNERCYAAIRHALFGDSKREPRSDKRSIQREKAKMTERLRSELAASNNAELDAALREGRANHVNTGEQNA